jgi:hypothetical protein
MLVGENTWKLKLGIPETPPVVAGATAISGSFETTGEPELSNNGCRNSEPTAVGPLLPNVNVASMSAAAGIMNVCHRYPAFPSPGHDALPPKLIVKFVAPVPEDCVNVAVPLFVAPEAGRALKIPRIDNKTTAAKSRPMARRFVK